MRAKKQYRYSSAKAPAAGAMHIEHRQLHPQCTSICSPALHETVVAAAL